MVTDTRLKQTPLYEKHLTLHAKMVPFGGWEMPLQYEGILKEYDNTRSRVSVFDTSHMGEFYIKGQAATAALNTIVMQSLDDMPLKTCRYGAMLNNEGGVLDDLIVYRIEREEWMVVVNGATMEKDQAQFLSVMKGSRGFENRSFQTGKLDIQGPLARDVLSSLAPGIEKLQFYAFDIFKLLGEDVIISRTGYTGELGYEVYFPWDKIHELWDALLKRGVKPAGLGVRDVLRTEMGYCLYGHELTEEISPLEAGLSKFIHWEKDFVGKGALLKEKERGVKRKLICLVSDSRRSPREQNKVFSVSGEEIGIVTSGTFSPGLGCGVGLGFISRDAAQKGDKIQFGQQQKKAPAQLTGRPAYRKGSLKN